MQKQKQHQDSSPLQPNTYKFDFTGSGKVYFRIWIVNILLSILTLGIYSAWAKVRTNQYFYRSMKLDNSGFDYHGSPIAILKGRIIAVVLLAALNLAPRVSMILYVIILILFLVIVPWLVTRSLAFRMRNSSWRAIRFQFKGKVSDAAKYMYAYGLLTAITVGIAYPVQFQKIKKFIYENTYFGKTGFFFKARIGEVYKVFLLTVLFTLLIFIGAMAVVAAITWVVGDMGSMKGINMLLAPAIIILYLGIILLIYPFFKARITNLIWNNVGLGEVTFKSTLTVKKYFVVIASNLFLTILTLGLYWPWALVKIFRLRLDYLALTAPGGLDTFAADSSSVEVGAAGEEISSAFDFDISF